MGEYDVNVANSFGIEVDGIQIKHIFEVSGLKLEQDVVEVKANTADGKQILVKMPGLPKAGEVTLVRGLTDDTSFDQWIKDSRFGQVDKIRKGGSIILYGHEPGQVVKRYKLTNAWPKSLEVNALKAGDNSITTEKLVVVFENMEVE
jgi:phage tail-like protein